MIPREYKANRRRARGIPQIGDAMGCAECNVAVVKTLPRQKYCPPCAARRLAERFRRYDDRNRERRRAIWRQHDKKRSSTPERKEQKRQHGKVYTAQRRLEPRHRLDHRMSQLVRGGLRAKNGRTWESLVGYSLSDLFRHIERQFQRGMSWANMGEWHIDHILPRAMFSYSRADDPQFKACWALTNLRPLWSEANLAKGGNRTLLL